MASAVAETRRTSSTVLDARADPRVGASIVQRLGGRLRIGGHLT